MRLAMRAALDQVVVLPAGPNRKSVLDCLKQDVGYRGGGLAIGPAVLSKGQLCECIVQFDLSSVNRWLLAEPAGQHGVFDLGKQSVLVDARRWYR